jgi:hypothetical protein
MSRWMVDRSTEPSESARALVAIWSMEMLSTPAIRERERSASTSAGAAAESIRAELIADDGGANAFFFASIFLLVKMAAAVAASFNVAEQDFVSFAWASYLKAAEEISACKGSVERAN